MKPISFLAMTMIVLALTVAQSPAQSYTFTTLAGSPGNSGSADGTGSAARFSFSNGIAVDEEGNVYVAESTYSTIRKITPAGVVTTLAGRAGTPPGSADGPGNIATFYGPLGLAIDLDGNLYVADHHNSTIRKVTSGGVVSTLAGFPREIGSVDGTGSAARFNSSLGIAVDTAGMVYVGDLGGAIRKITPAGQVTTLAQVVGTYPSGLAVDNAGVVYVADTDNHIIRKITPAGAVSTFAGQIGASGSADGLAGAARFRNPSGIAIDGVGNFFVTEFENNTIRKITPAGMVTTIGGAAGAQGASDGIGSAARFAGPAGVAVDGMGNLYITDDYNFTIRKGVVPDSLQFFRPAYNILENAASVEVTVTLSKLHTNIVTVDFAVGGGSATAGLDYSATNGTLTFQPGQTTASFLVPILNDGLVEGAETVNLNLSNAQGAPLGETFQAVLTITDNDFLALVAPLEVYENGGVATVTVTRVGEVESVSYSTADESGRADVDYSPQMGVMTFATGETNRTFTVPIVNNARLDGDRSFSVTLTQGLNRVSQRSITIRENDFIILDAPYVRENDGLVSFTMRRLGEVDSVNYSTSDGSARAGIDYSTQAGPIGFAPGETQKNFTIPMLDNDEVDGGRTFMVNIRTGSDSPLSFPIVIHDDELPPGGTVVAWGANDSGQSTVPGGLSEVVAIAAGMNHSLALKSDSTVMAWGANNKGQRTVPVGLNGVIAVAAGTEHSLALKSDGTVVAWGWNDYGQSSVPAGLTGVVAVAAGWFQSLALKSDGTVVAWGEHFPGENAPPAGLSGVVSIAAGGAHCLALKSDGTVVAWGSNNYGESIVPVGLTGVVAIAAGWNHSLALKSDGTVVAWGSNADAQSAIPAGLTDVVEIAAGTIHSLALKSDGTVVAWGNNSLGQTTVPTGLSRVIALSGGGNHSLALVTGTNQNMAPAIVFPPFSRVVTSGYNVTFNVLAAGEPLNYQWRKDGTNISGANTAAYTISNVQTNDAGNYSVVITNAYGTATSSEAGLTVLTIPPLITLQPRNQTPVAGWNVNFSVTVTGSVPMSYQWRKDGTNIGSANASTYTISNVQSNDVGLYSVFITNAYGSVTSSNALLMLSSIPSRQSFVPGTVVGWGSEVIPNVLPGTRFTKIAAGRGHTLAIKSDGTIVAWGANDFGQSTVPDGLNGVVAIAAGERHSLARRSDGSVVAWGYNGNGQSTVPGGLNGIVAIAAGADHSLALKSDGTVVAWGNNTSGQSTVPGGLNGVVAIAAGGFHSLALKSDGTVVAWGNNNLGPSTVPGGLNGIVAIAGGGTHSLALRADGTVVVWGSIWNGSTWVTATVPGGLNGVVAIAGGGTHSLALRADGTVVVWGQIHNGSTYVTPTVPAGLNGVVTIAAGYNQSLALKSDGTVVAWGYTFNGSTTAAATGPGINGVVAIDAERYHSLALKSDGTVVAWGYNGNGQSTVPGGLNGVVAIAAGASHSLALKSDGIVVSWGATPISAMPDGLNGVVAIAAGYRHSLALKSDGTVVAWGGNDYGQSTVPSGLNGVVAIAAGWNHSLALKSDGTVVTWGQFWNGSDYVPATVPTGLTEVVAITAGESHSLALKSDGMVVAWGNNSFGKSTVPGGLNRVLAIAAGANHSLALIAGTNENIAPAIVFPLFSRVVFSGYDVTFNVLAAGEPLHYQWRKNGTNINGANTSAYTIFNLQTNDAGNYSVVVTNAYGTATSSSAGLTVLTIPPLITLQPRNQTPVAGWTVNFSLTVTGSVPMSYQWRRDGFNIGGATGAVYTISNVQSNDAGLYSVFITNPYGSVTSSNMLLSLSSLTPMQNHAPATVVSWGSQVIPNVAPGTRFTNIAAGYDHSLALKTDGTVVAWGDNWAGQSTVPGGLNGVVAIASGYRHSLALKSDGTVVTWGANDSGQSTVPGGLTGVVAIAAGDIHSLALKSDGTVVAWGYNGNGQSTVPGGLNGIVSIDAGGAHSLALRADGTVVVWGQIYNGSAWVTASVPSGLNGVVAIAAGSGHSLALKSDGTVVAWGNNGSGQSTVPGGLNGVVAIAAGEVHSLALKSDGTVVAWGATSISAVPGGLNDVVAIAAGGNYTLALKFDGTAVAWGENNYGQGTVPGRLNDVVAIAAGGGHSLALKSDSTVLAWGENYYGETIVPAGLTGVVAIAAANWHSLALKSDGTVVAWGRNSDGESTVPIGLNGVVAIAAAGGDQGYYYVTGGHSLALKSDGTVVAWGNNGNGQSTVPGGLNDVVAIAAGADHSLALKSDGTVVAWGNNGNGQSTVPGGLNSVVAIAAGAFHSLALKSDGTVVSWGSIEPVPDGLSGVVAIAAGNYSGLAIKADGTVVAWGSIETVPEGLNGVVAIAPGSGHILALISGTNQNIDPALVVQASGNNFLLSWPLSAQTFALQWSTNLTDPNSWTTVTNLPVVQGSQNTVTDTISGPAKFYRLRR